MQRALNLSQLGKFEVAPNPKVGAVIVYQDNIIGEGYHRNYGEPHAEVNAIESVANKSKLKQSTIYVTLEPCSHFGKTPPCADLIIKHEIPKVVICNQDPFSKVNGSGIKKLEKNGVEVLCGILEKEGREVNKRFFTFHEKKRPYIILKWAQTADGFIGRNKNDKQDSWITSPSSKQLVHQWRAKESAILIGKNTALIDKPELTCREVVGKNPIRLLIDEKCEVDDKHKLFNADAKTIVFNSLKSEKKDKVEWVKMDLRNNFIQEFNQFCYVNSIQSVIIEGGANTLSQFIDSNVWDEARVFKGKKRFDEGIKAPVLNKTNLKISSTKIDTDTLTLFSNSLR